VATEKKKTGLGADAIFGNKKPESPTQPQPELAVAKSPSADKIRTTVMLAPDIIVLLNRLKEQSILAGNRQTQGEIIEEAIRALSSYKNIKV